MSFLCFFLTPQASFYPYIVANQPNPEKIESPPTQQTIQEPTEKGVRQQKILDINLEDLVQAGYEIKKKVWTQAEDAQLLSLRDRHRLDWAEIADRLEGRNSKMCYSRYRRLESRTKIVWTEAQDSRLCQLAKLYEENWEVIAQFFEKRNIKQVRQRYINYLHPDINKERWTIDEDFKLVNLINKYGLEWKQIEPFFEGRTQNQLKNRYFGRLKRISDKKTLKRTREASNSEQSGKNLG